MEITVCLCISKDFVVDATPENLYEFCDTLLPSEVSYTDPNKWIIDDINIINN